MIIRPLISHLPRGFEFYYCAQYGRSVCNVKGLPLEPSIRNITMGLFLYRYPSINFGFQYAQR